MAEPSKVEEDMKKKAKKALQSTTNPMEKLKLSFLARGGAGMKNLTRWLRIMDDDGNKKLNSHEFIDGIHKLGLKDIPDSELKEIYNLFDKDGNGQVNVTEFLHAMQPKMSKSRTKLVKKAFKMMDKSKDKVVTIKDISGSYDYSKHPKYISGEWNGKQCLREFLNSFDDQKNPDGKVTLDEFMSYYAALSCSIDNDAYFDLMMRQAWKIEDVSDSDDECK